MYKPNKLTPHLKAEARIKASVKRVREKFKPTGEAELFKQIWAEREHWCVHCQAYIREPGPENFDHILTKKQRPDLRLSKKNIRILCFDCHFVRHNGTQEQWDKREKKEPKSMGNI